MKPWELGLIVLAHVLAILLLVSIGGWMYRSISTFDYGNYIEFSNELGAEVDSLALYICAERTMCYPAFDAQGKLVLGVKANVPESGFPCAVAIDVYTPDGKIDLQADEYDCPGCDVDHYYILRPERAYATHHLAVE